MIHHTPLTHSVFCYKLCKEIPISAPNERSQKYIEVPHSSCFQIYRMHHHARTISISYIDLAEGSSPDFLDITLDPSHLNRRTCAAWQLHLGTPESHGLPSLSSRKNTKNTGGPPSPLMHQTRPTEFADWVPSPKGISKLSRSLPAKKGCPTGPTPLCLRAIGDWRLALGHIGTMLQMLLLCSEGGRSW